MLNMVFILIHDDCQYTTRSTKILGVFDDHDASLIAGWRTLLEEALKPASIRLYKKQNSKSKTLDTYFIQHWDMSSNRCIKTYILGEYIKNREWHSDLDKYLKTHHGTCVSILRDWYNAIQSNIIPDDLKKYTYEQ